MRARPVWIALIAAASVLLAAETILHSCRQDAAPLPDAAMDTASAAMPAHGPAVADAPPPEMTHDELDYLLRIALEHARLLRTAAFEQAAKDFQTRLFQTDTTLIPHRSTRLVSPEEEIRLREELLIEFGLTTDTTAFALDLAGQYVERERYGEAREIYGRILETVRQSGHNAWAFDIMRKMAALEKEAGEPAAAEGILLEVIDAPLSSPDMDIFARNSQLYDAPLDLAALYAVTGRTPEAEKLIGGVIQRILSDPSSTHTMPAPTTHYLAVAYKTHINVILDSSPPERLDGALQEALALASRYPLHEAQRMISAHVLDGNSRTGHVVDSLHRGALERAASLRLRALFQNASPADISGARATAEALIEQHAGALDRHPWNHPEWAARRHYASVLALRREAARLAAGVAGGR